MIPPGRRAAAGAALALGLACTDATRAAGGSPPAPGGAVVREVRAPAAGAPGPRGFSPVALERLDVTLGRLARAEGGRLRVETPKLRAVAPSFRGDAAELRFTYLGPTAAVARLASGRERRQLGLKLQAKDGCNLVYVMWRLAPVPGVVVQVKENPGASTHAACGAGGYRTVRPSRSRPPPAIVPGATHVLAARLEGTRLVVDVDGGTVWEGRVDGAAAALAGPIGVRTDNVRCELELRGIE